MSLWAVVPAKDPAHAKSRLAPAISQELRAALSVASLDRILGAIADSPRIDRMLVVSSAPSVYERAAQFGAEPIVENRVRAVTRFDSGEDTPLNLAIASAINVATRQGASAVLVIAGDLPLADARSLESLINSLPSSGLAIVPDRHRRGTNALLLSPPDAIEVAFGRDSFARHLTLARARGIDAKVCADARLALDIDTVEDLEALRSRLLMSIAATETAKQSEIDLLALVTDALSSGRPDELAVCGRLER